MALVLLTTDQAYLRTGDGLLGGGFDEAAHLLTGALVLAALPRAPRRGFAFGTLTMSVLIDVDHVPGLLGIDFITRGTDRPYSHSLATLALLGLGSIAWRSGRSVLAGAVVGLAVHFARDLTESRSGVALLWPWSYHSYTLPHWSYLLVMGGIAAAAYLRSWRARGSRSKRVGVGVSPSLDGA